MNFVLIGGTFASNPEWVRPGSEFRRRLEHEMKEQASSFHCVPWTAGNSFEDRKSAGLKLRAKVEEIASQGSDKIIVIAHSHGGYAALYALDNRRTASLISGVLLLGTPIFEIEPRSMMSVFAASAYLIVFIVYSAALLLGGIETTPFEPQGMAAATILICGVGFFFLSLYGIDNWKSRASGAWSRMAEDLSKELEILPNYTRVVKRRRFYEDYPFILRSQVGVSHFPKPFLLPRILLLTVNGDEAVLWLRLILGASDLAYRVWEAFEDGIRPWLLLYTVLVLLCAVFFEATIDQPWLAFGQSHLVQFWLRLLDPTNFLAAAFLMFPTLLAGSVVLLLLMLPSMLTRGHRFGTGRENFFQTLLVRVRISTDRLKGVPGFQHGNVPFRGPKMLGRLLTGDLAHSMFLKDGKVTKLIAFWAKNNFDVGSFLDFERRPSPK